MRRLLRTRRVVITLVASVAIALAACEGTRADAGRDAMLHVDGAQFFREAMPATEDGPAVLSATVVSRARAGVVERACAGDLERPATAVAIGLSSDVGYWVVPAGIPLASAPASPTFDAVLGLAASARPGRYDVVLRAVHAEGRFGPATTRPREAVPSPRPDGRFVISLSWQNEADLDLTWCSPPASRSFKRNRTEYQRPPGAGRSIDAPTDGGYSIATPTRCASPDGVRRERRVDRRPAPGPLRGRVDTFSLCGAPSAPWRVEATLDGTRIGAAAGTSTAIDARFDHNRGGGVLALEIDVP